MVKRGRITLFFVVFSLFFVIFGSSFVYSYSYDLNHKKTIVNNQVIETFEYPSSDDPNYFKEIYYWFPSEDIENNEITVEVWGAGGGGGYSYFSGGIANIGGGGGAGGYSKAKVKIIPGKRYIIAVGKGGTGGEPCGIISSSNTNLRGNGAVATGGKASGFAWDSDYPGQAIIPSDQKFKIQAGGGGGGYSPCIFPFKPSLYGCPGKAGYGKEGNYALVGAGRGGYSPDLGYFYLSCITPWVEIYNKIGGIGEGGSAIIGSFDGFEYKADTAIKGGDGIAGIINGGGGAGFLRIGNGGDPSDGNIYSWGKDGSNGLVKITYNLKQQIPPVENCANLNQIIMRLASATNSHVYPASATDSEAPIKICYDKIFGTQYNGQSPGTCSSGNANAVLGISAPTNAHAEDPKASPANYNTKLCYGDLSCRLALTGQSCDAQSGEKEIVRLNAATNAHVSLTSDTSYPYLLCCKIQTPTPQLILEKARWLNSDNQVIDAAQIGNTVNLAADTNIVPDSNGGFTFKIFVDSNGNQNLEESVDKVIKTFKILTVDGGVVRGQYGLSENDFTSNQVTIPSSGGIDIYFEVSTIKDGQTYKATSGALLVSRTTVPRDFIGYECVLPNNNAAYKVYSDGSKEGPITTLFTSDYNPTSAEKIAAGQACVGPRTDTSEDDCCPSGYKCESDKGCVFYATQCSDYKNENDCKRDPANVAGVNNVAYKEALKKAGNNPSQCTNTKISPICAWTKGDGESTESCKGSFSTKVDSLTYTGYCKTLLMKEGNCDPTTNIKEVEIVRKKEPEDNCNNVLCEPDKEKIEIPCGRPAFALGFFGVWQFVLSFGVIGAIYFILIRKQKNKVKFN